MLVMLHLKKEEGCIYHREWNNEQYTKQNDRELSTSFPLQRIGQMHATDRKFLDKYQMVHTCHCKEQVIGNALRRSKLKTID